MPDEFRDNINLILRDHEGYTGDGQGGVGELPVGDRSTARKPISKRDLREALFSYEGVINEAELYAVAAGLAADRAEEAAAMVDSSYATLADLFEAEFIDGQSVRVRSAIQGIATGPIFYDYDASCDRSYADGFNIVDPSIRPYDQGFGSGTGCLIIRQDRKDHFTISTSKTIITPEKEQMVVKGASLYDYLGASFEARTTYNIRPGVPAGTAGTSKATGYARIQWRSYSYMSGLLDQAVADGVNYIRVGVDPAMENTAAQDGADAVEYPSEMYMLGSIIFEATRRGIVVLLRQGRKDATTAEYASFMVRLVERYKDNPYVWYTPENEINAGTTDDVATWVADTETYLDAMRAVSTKVPIAIHTTQYSGHDGLDAVFTAMEGSSIIMGDPCLLVGFHIYQAAATYDGFFAEARQTTVETSLQKAYRRYCIFIDEIGISNNLSGGRDRLLDGDTGDHTFWDTGSQEDWMREYMRFVVREIRAGRLSGVCATTYSAYIPGTDRHDANSLRVIGKDGDSGGLTTWGAIFREAINQDWSRIPRLDGNRLTVNTQLVLEPYLGNAITIVNNEMPIPYGGISLPSSGLVDYTLYCIYSNKATSGNLVLSADTVAPVRDPATGNMVKPSPTTVTGGSGNSFASPNYTFVGLAYKTPSGWKDTATQRLVRSQWNRPVKHLLAAMGTDDTKAAVIEDLDDLKVEFVLFGGEYVEVHAASKFTVSGGTTNVTFRVQEDGATVQPEAIIEAPAGDNMFASVPAIIGGATDAYYDVRANGGVGGNSVTFKSGARLQGVIA